MRPYRRHRYQRPLFWRSYQRIDQLLAKHKDDLEWPTD